MFVGTCSISCVVRDMCGVVSVVLVCVLVCWFEYMCGLVRDIFKV